MAAKATERFLTGPKFLLILRGRGLPEGRTLASKARALWPTTGYVCVYPASSSSWLLPPATGTTLISVPVTRYYTRATALRARRRRGPPRHAIPGRPTPPAPRPCAMRTPTAFDQLAERLQYRAGVVALPTPGHVASPRTAIPTQLSTLYRNQHPLQADHPIRSELHAQFTRDRS